MNGINYAAVRDTVIDVLEERKKEKNFFICDLWAEYMEYSVVVINKEESTYANDETIYIRHIESSFSHKRIYDITPKDIITWHKNMSTHLARRTIINNHKTLSKLFNWADKVYDTSWNPAAKIGTPKLGIESAKFKIWTEYEFFQVYSRIDNLEHKTLMMLLFFCGFRRSEILALRWDDFIGEYLRVDEAVVNIRGKQVLKAPKTENSKRLVQLDCATLSILREFHTQEKLRRDYHPQNFIVGRKTKPMSFEALRNIRIKYQEQANIPHIKTHELRHSHVSFLINNNMPVIAIAHRIGDTVEEVLKTYAHLLPQSSLEIKMLLDETTKRYL